jgi:DNA polymerase I-like protein with 3'-5' exonuclease and polymerase domains
MSGFFDLEQMAENQLGSVKKKPWMESCQFILGTVDNLDECIDACIDSGRYSIDLECSGLDSRVFTSENGIQRTRDHIAGVGLSPDGVRGYYFPLTHEKVEEDGSRTWRACNIPSLVFAAAMRRLVAATEAGKTTATFHHGRFDQEFLQFNGTGEPWGEWDKPGTWDDTMVEAYLRNPRARHKGLKDLSKAEPDAKTESQTGGPGLGMEMIELYELFGHTKEKSGFRYDFTTLDPEEEQNIWYAASDVICTWRLHPLLSPTVIGPDSDGQSQAAVYKIEKACVPAVRWMERNRVHIDRKKVQELVELGQQEWFDAIMDVYSSAQSILGRDVMPSVYKSLKTRFTASAADNSNLLNSQLERAAQFAIAEFSDPVGKVSGRDNREWPVIYDVNSPQQLGVMFDEMGVPGLKTTEKSGQVKTSKDELNRVIEEAGDQFPFMAKIRKFREVSKALSSYLYPMLLDSDASDDTMRINFRQDGTDTGRFSTPSKDGAGARTPGAPQINLQSLPSTADPKRPACMNRLRECISARPAVNGIPRYVVAIDYAGVELRLVTNLSREPKWLAEFFHCSTCNRVFEKGDGVSTPTPPPPRCPSCGSDKIGDLHTLTGLEIYGKDAISRPDWKALRGHAKGTNFALCYGGGGQAVQRATGVDKNEGWRIKNQFDRTYFGLKQWWLTMHKFAGQHCFVRTAFGRRYPVPDIKSEDRGFQEKAKRNSVNGPIQGSSADVTKAAMALIYKECKKRGWLDKCQMVITMHDELVFEIDGDILEEAVPILVRLMTRNDFVLAKKWPIPLTTDVEIGYDWTVPWDLNAMRYKEVRFIGNKKIKSADKCPEGHNWDLLPSFPSELQPWFKESGGTGMAPTTPVVPVTTDSIPVKAPTPTPVTAPESLTVAVPVQTLIPTPIPNSSQPVFEDKFSHIPPGGTWTFKLSAPLMPSTASKLADVIRSCRGHGTRVLKLQTRNGESLEGWEEGLGVGSIQVSPQEFDILARNRGL